jgi:hypothetical protein
MIKPNDEVKHRENKSTAKVVDVRNGNVYAVVTKGKGGYEKGNHVVWLDFLVEIV